MTTETRAHALRESGIALQAVAALLSIGLLAAGAGSAQAQANPRDPFLIESFNCADIAAFSIEKQENLRAGAILEKCLGIKSEASQERGDSGGSSEAPNAYGGPDVNVHPSNSAAIQSESQSWKFGSTIVVTYNDLSGGSTGKGSFSTDGGATFARLPGDPFGIGEKDADDRDIVLKMGPKIPERVGMASLDDRIGLGCERRHAGGPPQRERMRHTPASGTCSQSGRCASSYSIS